MNKKSSKDGSLANPDAAANKRNARFEQEIADSRDHTKQSGRGQDDNKPVKPAGKSSD